LLLYYITDRRQFAGGEAARETALLGKIAEAARCGVDFIQLREKDLSGRELETLAYAAVRTVRDNSSAETGQSPTRILINSRTDVAIACAADGVHLTSMDIDPATVRSIWPAEPADPSTTSQHASAREKGVPIVTLSCHSEQEVALAASSSADFALFAPVFEKRDSPHVRPAGLETLRHVCRQNVPVIALGGVTLENARQCVEAGAIGIAGIRLFQENDIASLVPQLRH
jgi:thiamine-phosphate pyrophosphorylase